MRTVWIHWTRFRDAGDIEDLIVEACHGQGVPEAENDPDLYVPEDVEIKVAL